MKAIVYEQFGEKPLLKSVDVPVPNKDGALIKVKAAGVCLSDWHGWMGHDPDIQLPHVPGHEFSGVIEAVGTNVSKWQVGDRVTVPFIAGCGKCFECSSGNQQVCKTQTQPGFTHWGAFAEYVCVNSVDANLVALPDAIDFVTAASLGCRFATAFRAVVSQGKVSGGEWVVVHGCGGVGLSAIMIASALGAQIIAVDIMPGQLAMAKNLGAVVIINSKESDDHIAQIKEITHGGANVSIDAFGSGQTCFDSISCLRPRGRHVQVGLMSGNDQNVKLPMSKVLAEELVIVGSHGMPVHSYTQMNQMIAFGTLQPDKLISQRIKLSQGSNALTNMDQFSLPGMTVINSFVD